ncbi:MAG TPA: Trp biosynthesis-associated membrane protein [Actinophytocola sp.]|uniref:Trp biosynthesis-associated membrane protein n=1 Tax=Actinophytocola sp. TaxID=1872138 RepID=UPI002E07C795|nr:Trp biosynthesis-associated membrane protein [Actinophytocola sp.]
MRRPLWIAVGALLVGAVGLWGASRLTWVTESRVRAGTDVATTVGRTGADVAPLGAIAVLALAGVAASVATGGWARRLVGVVLVAAGVAAIVAGVLSGPVSLSWGRLLALLSGALVMLAGGLLVWFGDRMPRLGASYRAPGDRRGARDPDGDLWRSLSQGDDPTTGER